MNAFYQSLIDATSGSPIGALLVVTLVALLCTSVVWFAFTIADSWLTPEIECVGQIVELSLEPELSAAAFGATLTFAAPRPVLSEWSLLIRIGDQLAWATVSRKNYLMRRIGDKVSVIYSIGRISRQIYFRHIY